MLSILDLLKATQEASIACLPFIGKGNEKQADKAAVDAMRGALNKLPFRAKIVIGEGERDEAPMLFIGEELGTALNSQEQHDIAVDPLEGTTLCAKSMPGSLSVMAVTKKGGLLNAPDIYMDKIACPYPVVDLDCTLENNLAKIAEYKNVPIEELSVIILDRPRHQEIIKKVYEAGAKVKLITDGDIAAIIEVAFQKADLYLGIGGAPEGVLAAAALKTLGGMFQGRLVFNTEQEKQRATTLGIIDLKRKYNLHDLVSQDVIFCATGVTSGSILEGIKMQNSNWVTHSLVLDSRAKKSLFIQDHTFNNTNFQLVPNSD